MRFPGIRLVERTEQTFRRIRVCVKENKKMKTRVSNSRTLLLYKSAG